MRQAPMAIMTGGQEGPLTDGVEQTAQPTGILRSQPVESLPEFLTPEEFRAYVGISRSTMYDLLRRDEIQHVRFGRCIRIPKAVLQRANEELK